MMFSNLIALEQHQNDSQPFTSYVFLMKALVCNENDVKLFRNRGIVIMDNYTEKEVCDLFKRLCGEVEYVEDKFYFAGLIEQIFEYKRTPRSWRKILKFSWLKTRTSTWCQFGVRCCLLVANVLHAVHTLSCLIVCSVKCDSHQFLWHFICLFHKLKKVVICYIVIHPYIWSGACNNFSQSWASRVFTVPSAYTFATDC